MSTIYDLVQGFPSEALLRYFGRGVTQGQDMMTSCAAEEKEGPLYVLPAFEILQSIQPKKRKAQRPAREIESLSTWYILMYCRYGGGKEFKRVLHFLAKKKDGFYVFTFFFSGGR